MCVHVYYYSKLVFFWPDYDSCTNISLNISKIIVERLASITMYLFFIFVCLPVCYASSPIWNVPCGVRAQVHLVQPSVLCTSSTSGAQRLSVKEQVMIHSCAQSWCSPSTLCPEVTFLGHGTYIALRLLIGSTKLMEFNTHFRSNWYVHVCLIWIVSYAF